MGKQRTFSKGIEGAEIHYNSHIVYNDERGEQIENIDGRLDVRIFKSGQIKFRFWPEGFETNDEIKDIEINLKELLNIKSAIKLIRGLTA